MHKATEATLEAWSALLVAHRRLTGELDRELRAGVGLSLDEYDVLYQVVLAGAPLRMSELAQGLLVSRPTASRVVDRLVDRGWVQRWHDPDDRRVVRLELTAEGRRVQRRAGRLHVDGIARHVGAPLADHDESAFAAALRSLVPGRHVRR